MTELPSDGSEPAPPLPILHEDEDLIVVDKPAGLLVHATSLDAHELDNALDRLRRQLGPVQGRYLAPAHRLDKGTSGLLVFTRHREAARRLGQQFEQGLACKRYLALVRGWPAAEVATDHALARDPERPSQGQVLLPARTAFRRLAQVSWPFQVDARHPHSRYALVEARPDSGRRHQIRRHLKHLGHPIVGDATHGKGPHNRAVAAWLGHQRLWLHAWQLALTHPRDGRMRHWCAPPDDAWLALAGRAGWSPLPWAQAADSAAC